MRPVINPGIKFKWNPASTGLMCVYTDNRSYLLSFVPSIFAIAHTYNRALLRDVIMYCFQKEMGWKFSFHPAHGKYVCTLQQITAWRQKKKKEALCNTLVLKQVHCHLRSKVWHNYILWRELSDFELDFSAALQQWAMISAAFPLHDLQLLSTFYAVSGNKRSPRNDGCSFRMGCVFLKPDSSWKMITH